MKCHNQNNKPRGPADGPQKDPQTPVMPSLLKVSGYIEPIFAFMGWKTGLPLNRRLKKTFQTLLYLSLLFLISACGPLSLEESKPWFWKAEKDGKTSHFLGTFHYGISLDELPCSETILTELENSALVFTELGKPKDKQQQKQWNEALYLSPNNEDFNRLSLESQRFLEEMGVSRKLSYNAMSFVLILLCMEAAVGEDKALDSMDGQVESIALSLDIPLQALDTLELRKATLKLETKEAIERQIHDFPACPQILKAGVDYYKMGEPAPYDTRGLARWIENRYSKDEHYKWLGKNRNEKWFAQFKEALKSHDRIFVAAGNNHFTAPFNLIDMLKKDGFDIERISCSQPPYIRHYPSAREFNQ